MCACVSMNLCNAGLTRGMDDISLPPSLPPSLSFSLSSLCMEAHVFGRVQMRLCVSVYVSCMCLCASVCMHTCIQYIYTDRQTYCMHAYRQTEIWHRHACIHPSIRAHRHAFIGIFWMGLIRRRRSAGRHCCTRRFPLSLTLHRVDLLSKKLSCGTTPTTHWIQRRPPTFSASTHLCWCRPSSRRMLLPPSDSRLICVLSHYLPRSVSL